MGQIIKTLIRIHIAIAKSNAKIAIILGFVFCVFDASLSALIPKIMLMVARISAMTAKISVIPIVPRRPRTPKRDFIKTTDNTDSNANMSDLCDRSNVMIFLRYKEI
jgi:hypothetical protein